MYQPAIPAQPEPTVILPAEPQQPWWVAQYETYQCLMAEWDLLHAEFAAQRERRQASWGYRLSPSWRKRYADEYDLAVEDHAYQAFLDRGAQTLGTDLDFWWHQYLTATDDFYGEPDA